MVFVVIYFRSLQVCVRAAEEEAIGCDAVPAAGKMLGVPLATVHCSCDQADMAR